MLRCNLPAAFFRLPTVCCVSISHPQKGLAYFNPPARMDRVRSPDGVETVAESSVKETIVTLSFSSPAAKIICCFPTERIARRPVSEDTIPTRRISFSFGAEAVRSGRSPSRLCGVAATAAAFAYSLVGCSGKKGETRRPFFCGYSRTLCNSLSVTFPVVPLCCGGSVTDSAAS